MQQATARFLKYLEVERNASELTIKSYGEDLIVVEPIKDPFYPVASIGPEVA